MQPRVFITQPAVMRDKATDTLFEADYADAERFGVLSRVVESRPMILDRITAQAIERKLAGFTRNDYLLLSGDPTACAMCAMVASRATGGFVRLLRFDRATRRYTEAIAHFPLTKEGEHHDH